MKLLFIALTCISTSMFAQQKERKVIPFKKDSVKINKFDPNRMGLQLQPDNQGNIYQMPVKKPTDTIYSRMKNKKKDTTDYKILNSVKPEEKNKIPEFTCK
ncbi:hypothetical protein MKJ01_17380 [Chryseobacterium sp. SSA4.19]|uniref:hypothetical protein n=1 Tax=Chryseobacterium sp. SSA4.19 TaxID=2919915 RepID=UPI001F4DF208|nr:hypothetical protein [Chryseobacterium sp. SSA4.19]MCJ8155534.1 hypothetical protein [Chryseobacterium sp. SSA4.19]